MYAPRVLSMRGVDSKPIDAFDARNRASMYVCAHMNIAL
jgi:hypothetical protein